jgi:hypothetical protein
MVLQVTVRVRVSEPVQEFALFINASSIRRFAPAWPLKAPEIAIGGASMRIT